jgi:hypothetical protein
MLRPLASITVFAIALLACSTEAPERKTMASSQATASGSRSGATSGPQPFTRFTIVAESTYDAPIKTQVERHIVVDSSITAQSARALLEAQHAGLSARRGFRFHDAPTNVYIYLYTTRERALAGQGLWLAMLNRSYGDVTPKVDVRDDAIADMHVPARTSFGLTEAERMEAVGSLNSVALFL